MELLLWGVTKILKLEYSCITNILHGWVLQYKNAISIKLFFKKGKEDGLDNPCHWRIFKVLSYIISLKSNKYLCIYHKLCDHHCFLSLLPGILHKVWSIFLTNVLFYSKVWVGKIPWRKAWQPTPVLLPGESPWTEDPGGLQFMRS